jgi:DNA polymerase-3 subunit delta
MKEILTDSAFRKKIEKNPIGGYLFFGDEDYLKTHAIKAAKAIACPDPSLAVFNDMTVDCSASESFIDQLASALSAAPMMADVKTVTMTGLNVNDLKASEIDELCDVLAMIEEFDFNLLIISVPSGMIDEGRMPKRPSPVLSKLCEHLYPVYFPRVAPEKLASWMVRHFEHNGVRAEMGVAQAILDRCGKDMFTLSGEVDKLSFYAKSEGRDSVTLADVPHVTCPNEEFDAFALSSAVAAGNIVRALDVLSVMKARKVEPVIVFSELAKTLGDMLTAKILLDARKSIPEITATLKFKSDYQTRMVIDTVRGVSLEYLMRSIESCTAVDAAIKNSGSGYVEIEKLVCSL